MSKETLLINAIFDVVTPGREYTRNDIWNRLNAANKRKNPRLRLIPDEVKKSITVMCRRGMLEYGQIHTQGQTTSTYRRAS